MKVYINIALMILIATIIPKYPFMAIFEIIYAYILYKMLVFVKNPEITYLGTLLKIRSGLFKTTFIVETQEFTTTSFVNLYKKELEVQDQVFLVVVGKRKYLSKTKDLSQVVSVQNFFKANKSLLIKVK